MNQRLGHRVLGPHKSKTLRQRPSKFLPDMPRPVWSVVLQEVRDALIFSLKNTRISDRSFGVSRVLGGSKARPTPKDDRLQQRIAAEPIGAVYAHARALSRCKQARYSRLTPAAGFNPAHRVMRAGSDRDRTLDGIDTGKIQGQLADLREPLEDSFSPKMAEIEKDAFVHSPPFAALIPAPQPNTPEAHTSPL